MMFLSIGLLKFSVPNRRASIVITRELLLSLKMADGNGNAHQYSFCSLLKCFTSTTLFFYFSHFCIFTESIFQQIQTNFGRPDFSWSGFFKKSIPIPKSRIYQNSRSRIPMLFLDKNTPPKIEKILKFSNSNTSIF